MISLVPLTYVPLAQSFLPATNIKITVPVTNTGNVAVPVKVRLIIYEGSIWPGHGTKITEYTSPEATIAAGGSKDFVFTHTTVAGTIDRRDVGVEASYRVGSTWTLAASQEWDDLYYVTQAAYGFTIGTPTVTAA